MFDLKVAKQNIVVVEFLENGGDLRARFLYYYIKELHVSEIKRRGAGYVSPWVLVKAHQECINIHGAYIVPQTTMEMKAQLMM